MPMQIALHLGAHMTDEDRLIRCLMRNREALQAEGIAIPGTGRYRKTLRQVSVDLQDQPVDAAMQETLLDALIDEDGARRVVFSSDCFLAYHPWAIGNNRLYPDAGDKVQRLCRLFPQARIDLFLAIRSPATFLPALVREVARRGNGAEVEPHDPVALRWSDTIARIRDAAPDAALTVWCDEDAVLLWPEILRAVAGHSESLSLAGVYDWYQEFVHPEGLTRLTAWLRDHPPQTDAQRRRVLAAFLERYARPDGLEVEATLPGWPADLPELLGTLYDADLERIAQMPGVRFLEP